MQTKTTISAPTAFVIPAALLLAAPGAHAQSPSTAAGVVATATLRADQPGPVVNANIYGHFAEHLGRGIYEGIWVGPSSSIPNTRGIRNDVVAALKAAGYPGAALAGRLLRRRVPLEGRDRAARRSARR